MNRSGDIASLFPKYASKNKLRNKIDDSLLDDCLVTFIERGIFLQLSEEEIINTFVPIRRRSPDKK